MTNNVTIRILNLKDMTKKEVERKYPKISNVAYWKMTLRDEKERAFLEGMEFLAKMAGVEIPDDLNIK